LARIEKEIESNRKVQMEMVGKVRGIEEWVEEEGKKAGERDLREKI